MQGDDNRHLSNCQRLRPERTFEYVLVHEVDPNIKAGVMHALVMTFPLSDTAGPRHPGLPALRKELGYSHRALLVGKITPDNRHFDGLAYHMYMEDNDLKIKVGSFDWMIKKRFSLTSMGKVSSLWTEEKIIEAATSLTQIHGRKGEFGFQNWHCGMLVAELYAMLKHDPPKNADHGDIRRPANEGRKARDGLTSNAGVRYLSNTTHSATITRCAFTWP